MKNRGLKTMEIHNKMNEIEKTRNGFREMKSYNKMNESEK